MTARFLRLKDRTVLRLSGCEHETFLNGLVTNEIAAIQPNSGIYAALLTPQGKYLFDMLITKGTDCLYLDIEAESKDALIKRLMMYRLRADVTIEDMSDILNVYAVLGFDVSEGDIAFPDPRHTALGWRFLSDTEPKGSPLPTNDYEHSRIVAGVPDSSRDMKREKYFWLETDAERLNGVSFSKGCYIGQELNSRMKHRTSLKKCIVTVTSEKTLVTGTTIKTIEDRTAGEVLSSEGQYALAFLKLEYLSQDLFAGGTKITVCNRD